MRKFLVFRQKIVAFPPHLVANTIQLCIIKPNTKYLL